MIFINSLLKGIKMAEIKLIGTDVDGTLTDAGMYYTIDGDVMKKFNTHDGMGLKLCQQAGIKTAILTSENTPIVTKRAEKLKIDYLFQGMKSKLETITKLCEELSIGLENVAYIGDDINDYEILSAVGLKACPADAITKIKEIPDIKIMALKGGEGAVREFIDNYILT